MKKLLYVLATVLVSSLSLAQTNTENFIKNTTYQVGTTTGNVTNDDKIENITYFDGLGRPMQSIAKQAGGNKQDLITPILYDWLGRQTKEFLPYARTSSSLNFDSSLLVDYPEDPEAYITVLNNFYKNKYPDDFVGLYVEELNPYSEKHIEVSPLNRIKEQGAPGASWKVIKWADTDHTIKFEYNTNIVEDHVKHYEVSFLNNNIESPQLIYTEEYSPSELYKTVTKDENWQPNQQYPNDHTSEEFKNKQGQVVLKRTYNVNAKHDTYYVYDVYGNLTYVLPPKMEGSATTLTSLKSWLNELGYQYKYDFRKRLVEKRIPGKDWEYIVYNTLDLPILTQDANLRAQNKWLFTKYDAFGRVAYTGEMTRAITRTTLQLEVTNLSTLHETKNNTATTIDGTTIYYSNNAYPKSYITDILTINYYDDYTFDKDGLSLPSSWDGQAIINYNDATKLLTKGLTTGSKVRVLGTNNWITNMMGYNAKSQPIYVASKNNYLETTDVVKSTLDFTGKIHKKTSTHDKTGKSTITIADTFYFDHVGRLLKQSQAINGAAPETIVHNTYDALGQLTTKKVGNSDTKPLQTVDYTYNVRGWLKQINNPTTLGTELFAFKLNYNTTSHGSTALFNGNIAETEWKTQSDNVLRWYEYNYDALNRITSAVHSDHPKYGLANVNYDKNGNITNLLRYGNTNLAATTFGTMDNLSYSYILNSNKLQIVSDTGSDTYGFKDDQIGTGTDYTIDYTYDANGNMITDTNKGITAITYNHLNLPTKVTLSGGNISYFYDATGVKLKKTVSTGTTTEYSGNYIYENGNLKFFSIPEGYVEPKNTANYGSGFNYIYQYKDHLGNIRLSYKNIGSVSTPSLQIIEENNYYPFGLKHKGYNSNIVSEHDWKFQGQELEESLGLNVYEFELRQYDPAIGRFMTTDTYEQFDSPYVAMGNNPVVAFDPDGGFCYDANGNQIACPEGEFFDDVRDSETNHYNELKEVVIDSSKKENDSESDDDGNEESNEDTDNKISYTYTLTKPEGPIGGAGFLEFVGPGGLFKWKSLQQLLKTFTSKGGTKWIFGAFKTEAKWASQLAKRGWTKKQITEAISKGQQFKAVNNVNKANSATRYVHPATGKSVVIDDVTKELLHVGGPGFKY
jgi:RHS repeat-associated protein